MCVSFLISSKFPVRLNLYFFLVNAYTPHIVPLPYNPTGNSTNSYVALRLLYAIQHKPSLTPIFFYDCCMQYTYSALWLLYAIHHKPSLIFFRDCCMQCTTNQPMSSLSHNVSQHTIILYSTPPHTYMQLYYRTHLPFRSPSVTQTTYSLVSRCFA